MVYLNNMHTGKDSIKKQKNHCKNQTKITPKSPKHSAVHLAGDFSTVYQTPVR